MHSYVRHGKEAQELRKGIEKLVTEYATLDADPIADHCEDLRRQLIALLYDVDARDSLAYLERCEADNLRLGSASCARARSSHPGSSAGASTPRAGIASGRSPRNAERESKTVNDDEKRLHAVIAYSGSDVGAAMRRSFLDEVARLRRIELAARDAVNISLNDAGPAAFETMRELREALLFTSDGGPK